MLKKFLLFCISFLSLLYFAHAQNEVINKQYPNRTLILNIRDMMKVYPALTVGYGYHLRDNLYGESSVGFINPYSSFFIYYVLAKSVLEKNNYGLKVGQEIKWFEKKVPTRYKSLELIYQYERTHGDIWYRINNQYSQIINSTLDLHQARLNIKYGAFFDVDKVIHDFSFGLGFELRSDNNSVLDKYSNHTPQITDNNLFSSIGPRYFGYLIKPKIVENKLQFLPIILFHYKLAFRL